MSTLVPTSVRPPCEYSSTHFRPPSPCEYSSTHFRPPSPPLLESSCVGTRPMVEGALASASAHTCAVPCCAGYHGSGREFVGECSYAVSVYGSPIMSPDQFNGYGYGDGRVTSHRRTMLSCVGARSRRDGRSGRYPDSTLARVRMSAVRICWGPSARAHPPTRRLSCQCAQPGAFESTHTRRVHRRFRSARSAGRRTPPSGGSFS